MRIRGRVKEDALPDIGYLHLAEITPAQRLAVVRRVEKRGLLETTRSIVQIIGLVRRYTIATNRTDTDWEAPMTLAGQGHWRLPPECAPLQP